MPLINCPECGKKVSDKAYSCPQCGFVLQENEVLLENQGDSIRKWLFGAIGLLAAAVAVVGYLLYAHSKTDDNNAIVELTPEFITAIEKYDQLGVFSEGYAAVRKGDKWGYVNTKGEEVIPVSIEAFCVGRFSEGVAFVPSSNDSIPFTVIDTDGETVFKGVKGDAYFTESTSFESADMPYFSNGKLYVPLYKDDKLCFAVYDKQGNRLEQELSGKLEKDLYPSSARRFTQSVDKDHQKVGVMDSLSNIVIRAKYDELGDGLGFHISNGVVLVCLYEVNENYHTAGLVDNYKCHYGYADLKGNDTFSDELKKRCDDKWKRANEKYYDGISQAYIRQLGKLSKAPPSTFHYYYLFDITGDGIPELWVKSVCGDGATTITVFTWLYDAKKIYETGWVFGMRLFEGENCVFADYCMEKATKLTYENGKMREKTMSSQRDEETGRLSPEPSDKEFEFIDAKNKNPIKAIGKAAAN